MPTLAKQEKSITYIQLKINSKYGRIKNAPPSKYPIELKMC